MKLSIDHVIRYRFGRPQLRLVRMLRLRPHDSDQQSVAHWRIDVDCDARLRAGRDGFGNHTTMLYAEGPIDAIEIAVSGEVLTSGAPGMVSGVDEPFPPALFLRATALTRADATLATFARAFTGQRAIEEAAAALHDRFAIDPARPEPGLTAAEAFKKETATYRDMAQMLIAVARSIGVPARYVSGYSCLTPGSADARPHGWAEVFADDRWIAVDPCAGALADGHHVRIAAALDSAGAPPVAGVGRSDEEDLAG